MEKNWFECRVSYDKTQENGAIKRTTEVYLVEAQNFTEAESIITRQMQPFISGEFTVSAVRRRTYESVLYGKGDIYYRVKIVASVPDEKTGAEKKSNIFLFVRAEGLAAAMDRARDYMTPFMQDWVFHTIAESPVIDVFNASYVVKE